jgi:hypothetical protein
MQLWTAAMNSRRCDLIDREIEGTLTPDEADELLSWQAAMLAYRNATSPLPLEDVRALWLELQAKAWPHYDGRLCGD